MDPEKGHPELFLEGILRAGAGPYFDLQASYIVRSATRAYNEI